MKRTVLGLVTVAALSGFAGTASAAPPAPRVYPVYCGYTLMYVCGYCVAYGTVTNGTTW